MDRVVRVSVEFENGHVAWLDLEDAQEWYDAAGSGKLPKKAWGGGRSAPARPDLLDNVFAVIYKHMAVDKSEILGLGGGSGGAKRGAAFATYLAWYREPHVTLHSLALAFDLSTAGGLGVHVLRERLKEAAIMRKDKADMELLYKMLYALLDLDNE
jgi:hypothetical protein